MDGFKLILVPIIAAIIVLNALSAITLITIYIGFKCFNRQKPLALNSVVLGINLTIADTFVGLVSTKLLNSNKPISPETMIYCNTTEFQKETYIVPLASNSKHFSPTFSSCTAPTAILMIPIACSVMFMNMIALDRFLAVVFNIKYPGMAPGWWK